MLSWANLVGTLKTQIYVSRSLDPYLNLSIEHFLLQKSPPHSRVLFLYVNRPCVVIGRNQNPWLETNLKLLGQRRAAATYNAASREYVQSHWWENVQLVRRRSGGGTVFHDEGNVNYSVICPTADFTREKHAEMVTTAIREVTPRARVNERHDIVLDQGELLPQDEWPHPLDMHRTRFSPNQGDKASLKVSGSAYKLTRQRSLHHGTCLLASADLPGISRLLASSARPFIRARGVDSVRSPIGNIHGESAISHQTFNHSFMKAVIKAFQHMYNIDTGVSGNTSVLQTGLRYDDRADFATGGVGHELEKVEEIDAGIRELKVLSSTFVVGCS